MKELGIRAQGGNREAITALKHNDRLLAERKKPLPLSAFPWAVPDTAELAEHGIRLSEEERAELEDLHDEPWPVDDPAERAAFESYLERESAAREPHPMEDTPF
jgi:hypothetical protein